MNDNAKSKIWHRLVKVITYVFLVSVFFSPLFLRDSPSNLWFVDGMVNVGIWSIVIFVLKKIIMYIINGDKLSVYQNKINSMEPNTQPRSHAKDVFLNLASMVTLYASAVALLNLLFSVINKAYPQTLGYYSSPSISLPVATLIIVFPLYILFMWLIEKDLAGSIENRMMGIRKWLIYITLFISGGLIVGDLVTVLYYFLDGQELTTGFLLKILSIIVVAGAVFGYYITDVRNKLTGSMRKATAFVSGIFIIIAIIIGFSVIGSPQSQRLMKYDQQKFSELQMLSGQVRDYYQKTAKLPQTLTELAQGFSYPVATVDPQSGASYVYKVLDAKTFQLCATFNLDADMSVTRATYYYSEDPSNTSVWNTYKAGEYCFTQVVSAYPIQKPIN